MMIPSHTRILTWDGNPTHYEFSRGLDAAATYAEDVARTAAGEPTNPMPWGLGNITADIRNGTRVFLLRQGDEPRGIVAAGHVVNGRNRAGQHWADPDKTTRYVDVVFDRVIDADDPLPMADLKRFIPQHHWFHRQSGYELTDTLSAALLETLWKNHVEGKEQS